MSQIKASGPGSVASKVQITVKGPVSTNLIQEIMEEAEKKIEQLPDVNIIAEKGAKASLLHIDLNNEEQRE